MRTRFRFPFSLGVSLCVGVFASSVAAEESEPTEPTDADLRAAEETRPDEKSTTSTPAFAPAAVVAPSAVEPGADAAIDAPRENEGTTFSTQTIELQTGLRVVLEPTRGASEASVCTAIDAGVRVDPADKPGVARVLAEVMRDGGYRSASQDYAALVRSRGGKSDLWFDHESVVFCTTVPSSEVPLALWVASGRFTVRSLQEEELRAAVQRLGLDVEARDADVREGTAPERLRRMAFSGTPDYARARLPDEVELAAVTVADLRALHQSAYGSKRAVVTVSGGFEPEKIRPILDEQLGFVREGESASRPLPTWYRQTTERFSMAEDASAKTPSAWYGWVLPAGGDREALRLGLAVLTNPEGRAARKLASYVASEWKLSFDAGQGPGLARIDVVGRGSQSLGTIEDELDHEIDRLGKEGPSRAELDDAKRRLHEQAQRALLTPLDRARELSRGALYGVPAQQILAPLATESPEFEFDGESVRRAMAHYLPKKLRSVVEIYPKGWQDPWQAPMPLFHIVNPGESLAAIAKDYRTTVAGLVKMNSGLDPKKAIYPGEKLRVPRVQKSAEPEPILHVVKRGDTLGAIALKYGVSVRDIAEANGMTPKQAIRAGSELRIPRVKKGEKGSDGGSSSSKPAAPTGRTHQVRGGETWLGIAKKYGVTSADLAAANGKTPKSTLQLGQVLRIPEPKAPKATESKSGAPDAKAPKAPEASEASATAPVAPQKTHKVKSGETLSEIAKKNGVSTAELSRANHMTPKSTLRAGQTLVIPPRAESTK